MKKIIFLLLLAQTIAFLYGDAGCMGSLPAHGYQGYNENPGDDWGMEIARATKHTNCDCNCAQYQRAGNRCSICGHVNIPVALKVSAIAATKTSKDTKSTKTSPKKKKHRKKKHTENTQNPA